MQLKLRIQLNGMILDSSLSPDYPETKNVSFRNKLIPISWSETAATIDPETAKEYSSKVNRLYVEITRKEAGVNPWSLLAKYYLILNWRLCIRTK